MSSTSESTAVTAPVFRSLSPDQMLLMYSYTSVTLDFPGPRKGQRHDVQGRSAQRLVENSAPIDHVGSLRMRSEVVNFSSTGGSAS